MFLKASVISRGKGHNAIDKAAYISRHRLIDERTGLIFDYSKRQDLISSTLQSPTGIKVPNWALERQVLWNQVESTETRRNARCAKELVVTLPYGLTAESHFNAATRFSQLIADRYGVVTDCAIHRPSLTGDPRNFHAHVLITPRIIGETGFTERAQLLEPSLSLEPQKPMHYLKELQTLRVWWAQSTNQEYIREGLEDRLDALTPRYRQWLQEHRPNDVRLENDYSIDKSTWQDKNDQAAIEAYWAYQREKQRVAAQTIPSHPRPHHEHSLQKDQDFSL